jgi:hypothetical protein
VWKSGKGHDGPKGGMAGQCELVCVQFHNFFCDFFSADDSVRDSTDTPGVFLDMCLSAAC